MSHDPIAAAARPPENLPTIPSPRTSVVSHLHCHLHTLPNEAERLCRFTMKTPDRSLSGPPARHSYRFHKDTGRGASRDYVDHALTNVLVRSIWTCFLPQYCPFWFFEF